MTNGSSNGEGGLELPKLVATVLVTGATLTALAVFLGRLWTTSYFDYFGLPVSDLTLAAGDYAFRTKEVLLLLGALAGVAGALIWKAEVLRVNGSARRWWTTTLVVATVIALAIFAVSDNVRVAQENWRVLAVAFGIAIGVALGLTVARLRVYKSPLSLVLGAALVSILLILVPLSIVRLARASAANDVRTQNLAHAVIEFVHKAPEPIRRSDSPTRSTRVYLVLLTPGRIAIAFPYPCTQVATQARRGTTAPVCDILSFDRDQVRSVRVFGRGGRPTNDTRDKPESITLDVAGDDLSPRIVYRQGFDIASAAPSSLSCRDPDDDVAGLQGVWFRLTARQAGRIDLVDPDAKTDLYLASPVDARGCGRIDSHHGVRVNLGEELLLFVTRPTTAEASQATIAFEYAPLDARDDDCSIVTSANNQSTRSVSCAKRDAISFDFLESSAASVSIVLSVTGPVGSPGVCPDRSTAPQVLLSTTEVAATGCRTTTQPGRYLMLYGLARPLAAGQWHLTTCPRPGTTFHITDASVNTARIQSTAASNPLQVPLAPGTSSTAGDFERPAADPAPCTGVGSP